MQNLCAREAWPGCRRGTFRESGYCFGITKLWCELREESELQGCEALTAAVKCLARWLRAHGYVASDVAGYFSH